MNTPEEVKRKIIGYEHANRGESPTSIVVSWDIYYKLKEEADHQFDVHNDKLFGIMISVLQGDKNNQILLFK